MCLVFEELMQMLIPALEKPRVQAICEYSAHTELAEWTISYSGPHYDLTASGDELIRTLLSGMTDKEEYSWDENEELHNRLRFVVRRG
ncbi:MAG: hypothetical protein J6U01_09920 [Clostridia bacterium]|nr:hypothetical protein [Clostridia bacterium]